MTTWTLILLFVNTYGQESTAMTNVPGFTSQVACKIAGGETASAFTVDNPYGRKKVYYVCVKAS